MGLGMKDRQSLTREVAPRYQKARKAEKEKILDEFVKNTGYSRNYAIHILATWGKVHTVMIDGKPIRMVVGVPRTRKARKGKVHYGELLKQVLVRIWALFDYMCGKRLAIFIRQNIALLAAQEEFHIDEELQSQLLTISPATIDRILKGERKKLEIKGIRSFIRSLSVSLPTLELLLSIDEDYRETPHWCSREESLLLTQNTLPKTLRKS